MFSRHPIALVIEPSELADSTVAVSQSAAMSALSALAELGVHADRDGLHVMPPDQLAGAMSMQEECKEFLAKTKQFNDIVGDFIDVMESKSKVIEAEKLRAIGLANRVDHEKEVRKRKQLEVQTMINEKKAELERLTTQHESLMRVEMEQKALIEKVRALLRARVQPTLASNRIHFPSLASCGSRYYVSAVPQLTNNEA